MVLHLVLLVIVVVLVWQFPQFSLLFQIGSLVGQVCIVISVVIWFSMYFTDCVGMTNDYVIVNLLIEIVIVILVVIVTVFLPNLFLLFQLMHLSRTLQEMVVSTLKDVSKLTNRDLQGKLDNMQSVLCESIRGEVESLQKDIRFKYLSKVKTDELNEKLRSLASILKRKSKELMHDIINEISSADGIPQNPDVGVLERAVDTLADGLERATVNLCRTKSLQAAGGQETVPLKDQQGAKC
jgi:hypothetical protein